MNTLLNRRANIRAGTAAAVCLALTLGLVACGDGDGGDDEPGSQQLELVIGDLLPLSEAAVLDDRAGEGTTTSEDETTTSRESTRGEDSTTEERTTTGEGLSEGEGTTTGEETSEETTTEEGTDPSEDTTKDEETTTLEESAIPGGEELGEAGEKASELALAQIEAAIDEAGADHEVSVVHESQGADEDSAVKAGRRLVNSDGASCLTGPWGAESFQRTAEAVAISDKVLEISPTPTTDEIADLSDRDLVNSSALPVTLEGTAIAKAISRDLGGADGNTVNVAAINDSYGDSLAEGFIESWQDQDGTVGGQVVIAPPPLDSDDSSTGFGGSSSVYSAQVSQITSGAPDAVVLIVDPETLLNLGSALGSNFGWDPATVWGGDQLVVPGLIDEVGADLIGGMRVLAPGIPKGEEASDAFVREFKAAEPNGVRLQPFAAQQFDATILCWLGAVAAGSTDGQEMADSLIDITAPGGEEFSWQELPEAIDALESGEDIDYTGASGPIDMDVRGAPTGGVYDIYEFTDDRLAVAGEVSVSKPNPAAR